MLIVHRSIVDRFLQRFTEELAKLTVGMPWEKGVSITPLPELGKDVEIVEASSGFDALRLLPRGPYDLVITDINMPDINGLELVKFVRAEWRK